MRLCFVSYNATEHQVSIALVKHICFYKLLISIKIKGREAAKIMVSAVL